MQTLKYAMTAPTVPASTYNFYHDPYPSEFKMLFVPLMKLITRVSDLHAEYDSPVLTDILYLGKMLLT